MKLYKKIFILALLILTIGLYQFTYKSVALDYKTVVTIESVYHTAKFENKYYKIDANTFEVITNDPNSEIFYKKQIGNLYIFYAITIFLIGLFFIKK
jgi:hypothetical protein